MDLGQPLRRIYIDPTVTPAAIPAPNWPTTRPAIPAPDWPTTPAETPVPVEPEVVPAEGA